MLILAFILITIINNCSSFSKIPLSSYVRSFDNNLDNIKVIEPYFKSKESTKCVIFFTGGSSLVISDIYSSFLNKLAERNIAIYSPSFRYRNLSELINFLSEEYQEVILAGHSSGCTTALNSNNKKVSKYLFFDPVDTKMLSFNRNKIYKIRNINSILFLNAGKSYKFTNNPPGFPFIPFFALDTKSLNINNHCKIIKIEAENYGHTDILDKPYSNLMHKSRLSVGNHVRSHENLDNYHYWLGDVIYNFLNKKYSNLNYLNETIN